MRKFSSIGIGFLLGVLLVLSVPVALGDQDNDLISILQKIIQRQEKIENQNKHLLNQNKKILNGFGSLPPQTRRVFVPIT